MGDYTKYYTLDEFLDWMCFPEAARDVRNLYATIDSLNETLRERNSKILQLTEDNEKLVHRLQQVLK